MARAISSADTAPCAEKPLTARRIGARAALFTSRTGRAPRPLAGAAKLSLRLPALPQGRLGEERPQLARGHGLDGHGNARRRARERALVAGAGDDERRQRAAEG